MKLCGLWDYVHYEKKGHFIFTLTFWLKGFPMKNANKKYSYYGIE